MVNRVKQICNSKILKVIIESGELREKSLIEKASSIAIDNGADFIKTSTGKVKINATTDAAEIMLNTIKNKGAQCGFKASGGIKTLDQAKTYLDLANNIMGNSWIKPQNFRFGASSLLLDVLSYLATDITTDQKSNNCEIVQGY